MKSRATNHYTGTHRAPGSTAASLDMISGCGPWILLVALLAYEGGNGSLTSLLAELRKGLLLGLVGLRKYW